MNPKDEKAMKEAFDKAMEGLKAFNKEAKGLEGTIKDITGKK